MNGTYSIAVICLVCLAYASAGNILFLSLLPAASHHVWNEAVVQALLSKGHNITLLGHERTHLKLDNYTVLEIEGFHDTRDKSIDAASLFKLNSIQHIFRLWDFNVEVCEHDFKSTALKNLMNYSRDTFDLIIFDLNAGQCLYPLIEYFNNPPVVGVSPFGIPPFIADVMGNHIYPYIPFYTLPYSDRMSFWQRFHNVMLQALENVVKWCFYMPDFYRKAQKYFGEDILCFHEVERSIGLLLTNNDPVFDFPQPFPPNIIPVGGLHIKRDTRLPEELLEIVEASKHEELLEIVEASKHGVIYFSFGSDKGQLPSDDFKNILMPAFSKLNQTVLLASENVDLNVSKNVIVRKSFPRSDILAHTNTKLFITHGDSLSIQEAMYHGVPVIGIPLFGDQHSNLAKIVNKNLGKKLSYFNLGDQLVYDTVLEVIYNPIYEQNMKELAKKFRDQPQTPSDRAVFWIEYALRNKNLSHLNIAAKYMRFYETMSLDIGVVALLCVCLLVYSLHTIYQLILRGVQASPKVKKRSRSKQKKI
ncbi:UDP-glucoronosyl and UDP-glucosyl transferase [Popillia japonica]|uniref:UDP-glucoronosyl and UDP-glucosyl transferase n=1 Tax=Popillia japonica TaxID=7064 RepID=A0AAW1MHF6_POPJA